MNLSKIHKSCIHYGSIVLSKKENHMYRIITNIDKNIYFTFKKSIQGKYI